MKTFKKVPSFTVFCNDFKSRLTTAYPFLTADQIQLRLRKKWNDLSPQERINYYKTVLCPVMNENEASEDDKPKKKKKNPSKIPKDKNLPLAELTLFDDNLEVMSDKDYEKDFDDIFKKNKEDKLCMNTSKTTKTYTKSKSSIEHPVPMVIDETPFGHHGILKKSCSEKDRKMKVQFNFSPECNEISQDRFDQNNDFLNEPKNEEKKENNKTRKNKELKKNINPLKTEDLYYKTKDQVSNNFKSQKGHSNTDVSLMKANDAQSEMIEPLTPELQRTNSPRIIEKMCQAPKKKAMKGNFVSMENTSFNKQKNEALHSFGKTVSGNKSRFQNYFSSKKKTDSSFDSNSKSEEKDVKISPGDSKSNEVGEKKKKKNLKLTNAAKNDGWNIFSDSSVNDENIDNSIGWEISDESSALNKHSSSLENTLQLIKSVSSTSKVGSDHVLSDCSSLSGFSELSDQELNIFEMSDTEISDESFSSYNQLSPINDMTTGSSIKDIMTGSPIKGITASGDFHDQSQILKKNKGENFLCDLFDDSHSMLSRVLPPPGNNGEKLTGAFEDDSIFA